MTDFTSGRRGPSRGDSYSRLPYLYCGELLNSILKTMYHSRLGHFENNFCAKTYFGFGLLHKLSFHPLRMFLDRFA